MKRIGILVSEETKTNWQNFVDDNEFTTISMLIRKAVNFYIGSKSRISLIDNISKFTHDLKEPLTSIKGFSQLILENEAEKLDPNMLLRIKEIYSKSIFLEMGGFDVSFRSTPTKQTHRSRPAQAGPDLLCPCTTKL